jgi:Flp pilus assembly protein TadG
MTWLRLTPAQLRLRSDQRGATLVEFALLAPVFLTLLIGVLQVGLQVQNSNAVRNLASDGARFAVIQYQLDRGSGVDVIETWIRSRAVGGTYNLDTDRLSVTVTDVATSRVLGAREMRIQIGYDAPDFLAFVGGEVLRLDYERPVFLLDSAPAAPAT